MSQFQVGFARVNITPPMGCPIGGYFLDRYVEGVLDELEANAVAMEMDGKRAVMITLDTCNADKEAMDIFRAAVVEATGLDTSAILIQSTHTHVSASLMSGTVGINNKRDPDYMVYTTRQIAAAAVRAFADLKPAKAGWAVGQAPNIGFIRRFRMKDGSIRTNPGIGNPNIVAPIGEVDERLNVVRFVREGGDEVVIANYGCHPDTVGGSLVTCDWPGFARRTLEAALPGVKCVFFNGCEGDVNHIKVDARDGDMNGLTPSGFDDVGRGYEHAAHMGRVVAGGILQVYTKVNFVPMDELKFRELVIEIPSNMPKPEDMPQARMFAELHNSGRDCDIPYEGMALTTVVAESLRMLRLEHGPETFPLHLTAVAFGPIVMIGIPGEPFTGIGTALKAGSKYAMTMPCCLTNGSQGYFPMQEAYDEGGYEARSSNFAAGVAERIIENGLKLINDIL